MYKDYPLIYVDPLLSQAEIEAYLERAWIIIYEVEYDAVFQAFNGIYLNEAENQVEITFGFASSSVANMGMICINRETGEDHFDFPSQERVEGELAILTDILGTDILEWERQQREKFMNHLARGKPDQEDGK